jgi:hypothetical protein
MQHDGVRQRPGAHAGGACVVDARLPVPARQFVRSEQLVRTADDAGHDTGAATSSHPGATRRAPRRTDTRPAAPARGHTRWFRGDQLRPERAHRLLEEQRRRLVAGRSEHISLLERDRRAGRCSGHRRAASRHAARDVHRHRRLHHDGSGNAVAYTTGPRGWGAIKAEPNGNIGPSGQPIGADRIGLSYGFAFVDGLLQTKDCPLNQPISDCDTNHVLKLWKWNGTDFSRV